MYELIKTWTLIKLINIWPPYLGAGIKVIKYNHNFTAITVRMKLYPWNKNYVGTHFGGSLYSMVDPFYMLMLIHNLGPDCIVWDKVATINFLAPGRSTVYGYFNLSQIKIDEIKEELKSKNKTEQTFSVEILTKNGEKIASVEKTIYIRRKKH